MGVYLYHIQGLPILQIIERSRYGPLAERRQNPANSVEKRGRGYYPVAVQRLLMLSGRYLLGTSSSSSFSVRAAAIRNLVRPDQLTTFIALENLRRLFSDYFQLKFPSLK